jgi:hypothetical protein
MRELAARHAAGNGVPEQAPALATDVRVEAAAVEARAPREREAAAEAAPPPPAPREAPQAAQARSALQQLQLLSELLLQLDPAAQMEVAPVSDSEYEINSIRLHGHTLQSLGSVTATTSVHELAAACRASTTAGGAEGTT